MPRADRAMAVAVLAAWMTAAPGASGQATPTQTTLAESMFKEGQALMSEGRYPEACAKLQESQRLDPTGGTLLNLAVCHEHVGRIATAWSEFRGALVHALRDSRADRAEFARTRIAVIEPLLPRLVVRLSPSERVPPGMIVQVDAVDLGPAGWGSELPLDPGPHVVTAMAPGYTRFDASFSLVVSERREVVVPPLAPQKTALRAPAGQAPAPDEDPDGGRRTAGYLLGAGGLVALGVGSWYGVKAIVDRRNSDAKCNPLCGDEAVKLNDDAKLDARIADVGIGLGLVATAAGAYLILTTPAPQKRAKTGWSVAPQVTSNAWTVGLEHSW